MSSSRIKSAIFSLLLSLVFISPAKAQEDYILGPGDKIRIEVVGEKEMDTEAVISPKGTITFWVLGDIQVGGKSLGVFKDELTRTLLEKYLQKAVVKIEIKEYHSKEVVIQGAVVKPGSYYLQTNSTTVVKLISEAGGSSPSVGTMAYIIRGYVTPGKEVKLTESDIKAANDRIDVDLKKLLVQGDLQEDKMIFPGDYVFLSSTESEEMSRNYIWVEGAVREPGRVNYQKGLTLMAAIIQTGDFNEFASANKTTIHRAGPDGKTVTIKVKAKNIRKGKIQDVQLQPGDRITVPESAF